MSRSGFVPPYLLQQVAQAASSGLLPEPALGDASRHTLELDAGFRGGRSRHAARPQAAAPAPEPAPGQPEPAALAWTVHTANNTQNLPGEPVRDETAAEPSGDVTVDEAWDGVRASLEMFSEVFARTSYDGAGARVSSTVHYGRNYQNAFWDGTQLVFGDGDGRIFNRFTIAVDILAHELGHAVTEHTAGLVYRGQPGALNESMSDVFGSCLKQRVLGQDAAGADWLIGAGLFTEQVQGKALRSMSEPGTAYDDPALGKDPQPGHMDDFVDTAEDNGGVHINSGIPNKAFYLAATAIGGSSAEGAGKIWYDALLAVGPATDFAGFAAATIAAAGDHADAVRTAWEGVGVVTADDGADAPQDEGTGRPAPGEPGDDTGPAEPPSDTGGETPPVPPSDGDVPGGVVEVRRSGGVAGLTMTGELDLDGDDPRAEEARMLVHRVDIVMLAQEASAWEEQPGRPDSFTYVIVVAGYEAVVPEDHAAPEILRLAEIVLTPPN
ncbi:protealysin inhibitor emfourin [Myceligenerans crystallogenes]|uniref:Neutral metalloproteinase n=1 Tax=Myceligenerans crystallogenes TaxID=316335 RepID=A0ABN2NFM1_9MICO